MKKIINGKRYDTSKAKEIGYWSNNLSNHDFNHCDEWLYKKRTGEYFLYGEGGPMTRYAERVGDMWGGGSEITPLSYEDARQWAEEHLDADEYEAEFEIPDDDKIVTSISLNPTTYQRLKRRAAAQNKSLGEIIDELVK